MKPLALVMALVLSGCASYRVGPADLGQAIDSATTAIAIYGTSAIESNGLIAGVVNEPWGMAAVALFKQGLVVFGKSLALDACRPISGALFGLGTAAGINNLIVIAGTATPGAVVVFPGAALLWWIYDRLGWWRSECRLST